MSPIQQYKIWNQALWHYFFPKDQDHFNPILYLDATIIKQIAKKEGLSIPGDSFECDFLTSCLPNQDRLNIICNQWYCDQGNKMPSCRNWENFVEILEEKWINYTGEYGSVIERIPAYFGSLCAIMYLACTTDTKHHIIKENARVYLGGDYQGKVGELIDDLLWCLYLDAKEIGEEFDCDRMICGQQRNMSRIKFHTILRASDRDDFIDFLEINNLKWDYERYSDFINDRVIPMLNKAGKRQFVDLVTKKEYVPYVKNILQSGLSFGKTESVSQNIKQSIDIVWKYELYFDSNGEPSFYISANSSIPFGLSINDHNFIVDDSNLYADYIASETDLYEYESCKIDRNGDTYILNNIGSSEWKEIIFKKVANGIYHQVPNFQDGNDYIKFISKSVRNIGKLTSGWTQSDKGFDEKIQEKYHVYEVSDYKCDKPKTPKRSSKVNDTFCLYGVGTWFSIVLQKTQKLYWHPDTLDSQYVPVNYIVGADNKCYFRLPRTSESQISGKLIVTSADLDSEKYDTNEPIIDNFEWKGDRAKYFINGWGEISDQECLKVGNTPPRRRQMLQVSNEIIKTDFNPTPAPFADMLIQILYDVADENGCVNQTRIVAAIDFVLGAFNIIPTKQNRRSILFALRRLGYLSSFYSPTIRAYVNQLTPSYLELSNYSIYDRGNAYLVKGVYSAEKITKLIDNADRISNLKCVCYKRPYDDISLRFNPEYKVLPDLILLITNRLDDWRNYGQPIAESLIDLMSDISGFEEHFCINGGGDHYPCPTQQCTPCMIKTNKGTEVLCTGSHGSYIIHETYCNDKGEMLYIPKHLSRAYCQKEKNAPACIMERDVQGIINLGNITFASGMAKPQIMDMALCDLNLGLPSFEYLFIVNQKEVIQHKYPFIEGNSYSTHATATDNQYLKKTIAKVSGRSIDDFANTPAICVSKNRRHANGYQMKIWSDDNNFKALVLKSRTNSVVAFSWGKKIYAKNPNTNMFYEVNSEKSTNEIFSDIIMNKQRLLTYGEKLSRFDMSRFDDDKKLNSVRIIIKN